MSIQKPNLIYIFADQLRFDTLGCNGNHHHLTPNLDTIAEHSVVLENAVSGHPVCAPYRASLLTGKYTTSTGMVINELRMNPNHRCFAHVLNDSGYETCYVGKWHMYANQLGHHYNSKNSFVPKGPDRLGFNDTFIHYNFHHEYYAPKAYYHLDTNEKHYVDGYEPDAMTDIVIDEMKRLSENEKPFALFYSIGTPHDPWTEKNVPKEYLDMVKDEKFFLPLNYAKENDKHADMWARLSKKERKNLLTWMKVYAAMVRNLDDNVGRIYRAMKKLNLEKNTIFVFTSDHGEMFGSHGRRAKNIFYDEAVHVPFLLQYSERLESGRKHFCFNTVDIMPTLLSMMGLSCPKGVEGTDLSSCLFSDKDSTDGCLLMGTGPTAFYANGREWRGIRNESYTYAIYRKDHEEHLYYNVEDPYQRNNLARDPAYAQIKTSLKEEMFAKMNAISDGFWPNKRYKRRWIRHRIIKKTATLR